MHSMEDSYFITAEQAAEVEDFKKGPTYEWIVNSLATSVLREFLDRQHQVFQGRQDVR